jgi:hypothetical protein
MLHRWQPTGAAVATENGDERTQRRIPFSTAAPRAADRWADGQDFQEKSLTRRNLATMIAGAAGSGDGAAGVACRVALRVESMLIGNWVVAGRIGSLR